MVFDFLYGEFYEYFEQFRGQIEDKRWYMCNEDNCDTPKAITSALIRYIAQRSHFRGLTSQSSSTEILSLKNMYNRFPILLEDLKLIDPNHLAGKTRVLINGETFFGSKNERINDLQLEDYVKVINNPEVFTSTDDISQQSL